MSGRKWQPSYEGSNVAVIDWNPQPAALKPFTDADCPWFRDARVLGDNLYLDESGEPTIAVLTYRMVEDSLDEVVVRGFFNIAHVHWVTLKVTWLERMEDEHGLMSPCEVHVEGLSPILIKERGVPEPMLIFWQVHTAKVYYVPVCSVIKMELGETAR